MSQIIIDLCDSKTTLKEAGVMLLRMSGWEVTESDSAIHIIRPSQGVDLKGELFTPEEVIAEAAIAVSAEAPVVEQLSTAGGGNIFAANPVVEQQQVMTAHVGTVVEGAQAAGGAERDSAGHTWDKRIHSSGKTTVANGTWKMKKGVDKTLVDQVLAEQHAVVVAQQPSTVVPAQQVTSVVAGASPVTVSQPTSVAQHQYDLTWPIVLQRVTIAQNNGTLNHAAKDKFLEVNGITGGFPLISTRPDLFEAFLIAAEA